ncbi:MAG: DUF2380 domain-containing protein [Methylophaga sp.]|nr:DUF2380 domain-containing protein [Methylophaga sp.]
MKNITLTSLLLSLFFVSNPIWANTTIAVTNFELLNLTLKLTDPKKVTEIDAQDQQNMSMINELLQSGLSHMDGFTMIKVSENDRVDADKAIGFLFDCARCSADLGRNNNADYIIIGRLHKPTYLFSYLIARIFDTKTNKLVKEYRSEVKGMPSKSIPGAVGNLLHKINKDIPH